MSCLHSALLPSDWCRKGGNFKSLVKSPKNSWFSKRFNSIKENWKDCENIAEQLESWAAHLLHFYLLTYVKRVGILNHWWKASKILGYQIHSKSIKENWKDCKNIAQQLELLTRCAFFALEQWSTNFRERKRVLQVSFAPHFSRYYHRSTVQWSSSSNQNYSSSIFCNSK